MKRTHDHLETNENEEKKRKELEETKEPEKEEGDSNERKTQEELKAQLKGLLLPGEQSEKLQRDILILALKQVLNKPLKADDIEPIRASLHHPSVQTATVQDVLEATIQTAGIKSQATGTYLKTACVRNFLQIGECLNYF